ncbi:MAG: penicillin-binding protein activator, partial [Chloroflexi bacterium]|nr:penicillin-binding protein activator [Chloroflexota bacterium]
MTENKLSRRDFLRVLGLGGAALLGGGILNACTPDSPVTPVVAGTARPAAGAA